MLIYDSKMMIFSSITDKSPGSGNYPILNEQRYKIGMCEIFCQPIIFNSQFLINIGKKDSIFRVFYREKNIVHFFYKKNFFYFCTLKKRVFIQTI